ncbi:MAG: cytochrome c biogenesis protein ResB [Candidatus Eremiobacteraeota bacterium]|nr:cytochrome c biogenesis protein ResB [Candidatus Eremiobacteraeota bacterium]
MGSRSSGASLWAVMGSPLMAVLLIVLVLVPCIVGTLIPQNLARSLYFERYSPSGGALLLTLGLDHVYETWWFLLLLCLVALNLAISSLRRLRRLRLQAKPVVTVPVELFADPALTLSFPGEGSPANAVAGVLRKLGYRGEHASEREGRLFFAAWKGGLQKWGSFVTHMGLLVIFVGAIAGHVSALNFSYYTEVDEGQEVKVRGAAFTMKLLDFFATVNSRGFATEFTSLVEVKEEGQEPQRRAIRVNHPFHYRDIWIYQATCGVRGFSVTADEGGKKVQVFFPLGDGGGLEVKSRFNEVKGERLVLYVHNFLPHFVKDNDSLGTLSHYPVNPAIRLFVKRGDVKAQGEWEEVGWLKGGEKKELGSFIFQFQGVTEYSGFIVRSDRGIYLVWAGFLIVALGLFLSCYGAYRMVRLMGEQEGSQWKVSVLFIGDDRRFDRERRALIQASGGTC